MAHYSFYSAIVPIALHSDVDAWDEEEEQLLSGTAAAAAASSSRGSIVPFFMDFNSTAGS